MELQSRSALKVICFLLFLVGISRAGKACVEEDLESKRASLQTKIGYTVKIITFNDEAGRQSARILWVKPTSVRQIKRLVRAAKDLKLRIRVVGAAYSWSPLFPDPCQIGVNLDDLRGEKYHLNQAKNKLTVLSSEKLGDVIQWAAERGVTLGPVPISKEFTILGIAATSSHGSSRKFGPFANMVYGYALVDGSGNIKKFNEDDNKEIMDACRVHLGLCGIIYKTTIKVLPDLKQKFTVSRIPIERILDNDNRKHLVMNNFGAQFSVAYDFKSATIVESNKRLSDPLRRIPESYDIFKEDMNVWLWSDVDQSTALSKEYIDTITLADGSVYNAVSMIARSSATSFGQAKHSKDRCQQTRSVIAFIAPESDDFTESRKTLKNNLKIVDKIFKNVGYYPDLVGWSLFRWMKHFDDCLLCTTKVADNSSKYRLVTYTGMFTRFDKCNEPTISEDNAMKLMLMETQFGVGTMKNDPRVLPHWAKYFPHVPGTTDQIRRQFGDDLLTFINLRNKYKLDNKDIFVNNHLKDIFRDAFAKTCRRYTPFN